MKNIAFSEVVEIAGGDVRAWIEQGGAVHIKAVDRYGDPVEIAPGELKSLIEKLSRLHQHLAVDEA